MVTWVRFVVCHSGLLGRRLGRRSGVRLSVRTEPEDSEPENPLYLFGILVSERRLELPRAKSPLGPQPSASTNSATPTCEPEVYRFTHPYQVASLVQAYQQLAHTSGLLRTFQLDRYLCF